MVTVVDHLSGDAFVLDIHETDDMFHTRTRTRRSAADAGAVIESRIRSSHEGVQRQDRCDQRFARHGCA
jgi:hypothetical protein